MHEFERAQTRLRAALAAHGFHRAALRLRLALKRNPYWHLQPRVPGGVREGGQWTAGGELVSVLPSLILRELARYLAPYLRREVERLLPNLRRLPGFWQHGDGFHGEREFDPETRRIAPPSPRRPGHPLIRFRSESELRNFLGPAGPGREWHHIVEKRLAGRPGFPVEMIHATDNIINLPVDVHRRISARMSSKEKELDGLTRRNWTEQFSFAEQYNMGVDLIVKTLEDLGYDVDQF